MNDGEGVRIHETALKALEETGVFVDYDEALDLLGAAGVRINRGSKVVPFLKDQVELSLATCPDHRTKNLVSI